MNRYKNKDIDLITSIRFLNKYFMFISISTSIWHILFDIVRHKNDKINIPLRKLQNLQKKCCVNLLR